MQRKLLGILFLLPSILVLLGILFLVHKDPVIGVIANWGIHIFVAAFYLLLGVALWLFLYNTLKNGLFLMFSSKKKETDGNSDR